MRCCRGGSTSRCTRSRICPPSCPTASSLAAVSERDDAARRARAGAAGSFDLPAGRHPRHQQPAPPRAAASRSGPTSQWSTIRGNVGTRLRQARANRRLDGHRAGRGGARPARAWRRASASGFRTTLMLAGAGPGGACRHRAERDDAGASPPCGAAVHDERSALAYRWSGLTPRTRGWVPGAGRGARRCRGLRVAVDALPRAGQRHSTGVRWSKADTIRSVRSSADSRRLRPRTGRGAVGDRGAVRSSMQLRRSRRGRP